jgi:MSHA biogenesis protein MshG
MTMDIAFAYRARDTSGAERRGVRQASSAVAVAQELSRQGLTAVDIRPQSGAMAATASRDGNSAMQAAGASRSPSTAIRWPWPRRAGKATRNAFGMALRELAALLRAGIPLMRALQLAADTAADPAVKAALVRLADDLDSGLQLTQAAENEMRRSGLVDAYDVAMLQVGEQTGRLPECFLDMHRHREFISRTQAQVGGALRYPAFVVLTCLMALVVANIWVIPQFARVFANARAELPLLTQLLLGVSGTVLKAWPAMLGAALVGSLLWVQWTGSGAGRLWWDRVKLRLPIVGPILMGIQMSRLASSLSSAIAAGLTVSDALVVASQTMGNQHLEARIHQMCADLARGTSIAAAARNMGVLPNTMQQMFAIGEESGALESLMREMGEHYGAEVDQAISKLAVTIEPLMIWIMGIGVLVLALGIFLPMWDLGRATLK